MTDYYEDRCEQASAPEDRLTALHDDLLISILSFLSIKQRVALSAVCSRFYRLLPSIPRLDTFCLLVRRPYGGFDDDDDVHQGFAFPHSLIRQCRVVFCRVTDLPEPLEQMLVHDLVEAGVQDLILEHSEENSYFSPCETLGFLGIKSLRSLTLHRMIVSLPDGRPLPPIASTLLTSFKMEDCILGEEVFLHSVLASCPFLKTLHLRCCSEHYNKNLCIHSASIKHLVLLQRNTSICSIYLRCPKLESLTVDVATELRIEAPKVRNASLFFLLNPPQDPPDAMMTFLGAAYSSDTAWLMLNSSRTPNILAAKNGINRFIHSPRYRENVMIFNLNFNLKDRWSTMILTQFLNKCNDCNTHFDIRVGPTRIQNANETARDDRLLPDSTDVAELIKLRMAFPKKTFRAFLSDQKEMMEKLKQVALQKLKSRNSNTSDEFPVEISSNVANCIEMEF